MNSKIYAWRESLRKGADLCAREGHSGDAATLLDIIAFLEESSQGKASDREALGGMRQYVEDLGP